MNLFLLSEITVEPWASLSGHVILAVLCVMLVTKYIPALLDRHDKKESELREWHKEEMTASRSSFERVMADHAESNRETHDRLADSLNKLSTEVRGLRCLGQNQPPHGT